MTPDEYASFVKKIANLEPPPTTMIVPSWVIDDLKQVKMVPISQIAAHLRSGMRK